MRGGMDWGGSIRPIERPETREVRARARRVLSHAIFIERRRLRARTQAQVMAVRACCAKYAKTRLVSWLGRIWDKGEANRSEPEWFQYQKLRSRRYDRSAVGLADAWLWPWD